MPRTLADDASAPCRAPRKAAARGGTRRGPPRCTSRAGTVTAATPAMAATPGNSRKNPAERQNSTAS
eukprot:7608788-Pyramimonas_sp.AAC.1